jgi:RNA polymerase sigma factor (sigma-70 family)
MNSKKIFLPEKELIAALQSGEIIAIRAIYDMYSEALLDVISRIVPQPILAEDLLQETLIKIWYSSGNYDSKKGRLFTWMINIAKNSAIDLLRSKNHRNSKKSVDIEDSLVSIDKNNRVSLNIDTIAIRDTLSQLTPDYSLPLEMVYFKGYTHIETASKLHLPLGTLKTRIRVGLKKLRTSFV